MSYFIVGLVLFVLGYFTCSFAGEKINTSLNKIESSIKQDLIDKAEAMLLSIKDKTEEDYVDLKKKIEEIIAILKQ